MKMHTQYSMAQKLLEAFFNDLKSALEQLDAMVISNQVMNESLNNKLYEFLYRQLPGIDDALVHSFPDHTLLVKQHITKIKRTRYYLKKLKVDLICKKIGIFKQAVRIYKYLVRKKDVIMVKYKNFTLPFVSLYFANNKNKMEESPKTLIKIITEATTNQISTLSKVIIENNKEKIIKAFEDSERFNKDPAKKKLLIITTAFPTTWSPLLKELKKEAWSPYTIVSDDVNNSDGYGCLNTKEINFSEVYIHNLLGTLIISTTIGNHPILLSGECYHGVSWHADRALLMFMTLSSVAKTIKLNSPSHFKNLFYIMYDGLKPLNYFCNEVRNDVSKYYVRFMKIADKIIFNSNGESFGKYIENAYEISTPRIHFPRYSVQCNKLHDKLSLGENFDEFHIATITASLDGRACHTRYNTPNMIRSMIEQGIHIHSYTGEEPFIINNFINSLKPEHRKYFHVHPVNRNQDELVSELHQYHAGINGADHFPFLEGITQLQDRKYADGVLMFMQATYPTSLLVYAAAGLPIILPNVLYECVKYFGKFAIPMCLSEYSNLKNYLIKSDLPSLFKDYKE